jgi:hypothetical protein
VSKRDEFFLSIPVSNDGKTMVNVSMWVPRPMSEKEWRQLFAVLEVMKPGLVEPPDEADAGEQTSRVGFAVAKPDPMMKVSHPSEL